METQVMPYSLPSITTGSLITFSLSDITGTSFAFIIGLPILTRTVLTLPFSTFNLSVLIPAKVSTVITSLSIIL